MATVIPRSYIENYSNSLNGISESAKAALVTALSKVDYSQPVADVRNAVIAIMQVACGASTDVAARLAAEFYNGLRVRMVGETVDVVSDSMRNPDATDGAIRAFVQLIVDGGDTDAFIKMCADRLDYENRRAANECVAYNAKNDPMRPKWARIPAGEETCDFCIMLASRGFVYHSEETASHAHANCVVADTEVAGIGLLAGMRREYKGTLVNIRTRGGRNLTVTPNHPILTTRGWVVAGEIKELDNLICANFIHGDNGSVPDINDVPPTAKEVFESCGFMDSTLFDSVPVAAENLNGEIIGDSNIKVINPLGFLKRAIETTINEPIEHGGFSVAQSESSVSCPLLDAFGAFNLFGFRNNPTSNSIMGGCGLCSSFFGGHSRSANDSSFGLVARSDSSFREPPIDNLTADVETVGDGINALSVIERFENAIGHWDSLTACLDAIAFEYTKNGCFTASDFLDNLFSGSTRLIEIDDVESISFSERSCHVYNLSTKGGWYVSSGIITHNCDCRIVPSWDKSPLVQGYDPDLYYDMWKHPEKYENAQPGISTVQIVGVSKGEPMNFDDADGMKANPGYESDFARVMNCQTCVVANEARRRGYEVQAQPYSKQNEAMFALAERPTRAYINPETGEEPEMIRVEESPTKARFNKLCEKTVKDGERYHLRIETKAGGGHVVCMDRDENGVLRVYDPQDGSIYKASEYLKRAKYSSKSYGITVPEDNYIFRVDNAEFNIELINRALEPAK